MGADGEVLFDQSSSEAFALEGPVAAVWRACSGERSVEDIADVAGVPIGVVGEALVELERCGLLEEPPAPGGWSGLLDRRGLLVRGALLSIPLIVAVRVPSALAAASPLAEAASSGDDVSNPDAVAFSPDFDAAAGTGLIAIVNSAGNTVEVFSYDASPTPTLTMVASSSTGLSSPDSVAISPDFDAAAGTGLIAVTNFGNNRLDLFTYTPGSTPTLTRTASSNSGVSNARSVAFSPDFDATTGTGLIAVANFVGGTLEVFTYSAGSLTEAASSSSGVSDPNSVAFSPDFKAATGTGLIALSNFGNSTVEVFTYAPGTTPTLTEAASSGDGLMHPYSVAFSPDFEAATGAGLLAVASYENSAVEVFTYAAGATPTLTEAATSSTGVSNPISVAFSRDFNATAGTGLLAVANYGGNTVEVFTYAAGTTPTLTEAATSSVGVFNPYAVAFSPDFNASTGTGLVAAVNFQNSTLEVFTYTA